MEKKITCIEIYLPIRFFGVKIEIYCSILGLRKIENIFFTLVTHPVIQKSFCGTHNQKSESKKLMDSRCIETPIKHNYYFTRSTKILMAPDTSSQTFN